MVFGSIQHNEELLWSEWAIYSQYKNTVYKLLGKIEILQNLKSCAQRRKIIHYHFDIILTLHILSLDVF